MRSSPNCANAKLRSSLILLCNLNTFELDVRNILYVEIEHIINSYYKNEVLYVLISDVVSEKLYEMSILKDDQFHYLDGDVYVNLTKLIDEDIGMLRECNDYIFL